MSQSDPFTVAAPSLADKTTGAISFFTKPAGALYRLKEGTFIDGDVALFITATVANALKRQFAPPRKLHHVLDFSQAIGYNTHARVLLTNWALGEKDEIQGITCVLPTGNAVFKMGMSTVLLSLRTGGVSMATVDSFDELLGQKPLKPL
jgi:hypothetical protein